MAGTTTGTARVFVPATWRFLGRQRKKKVNFGKLGVNSNQALLAEDERRQLDRWGHLKLGGTKTLVGEQPRAGRDAGCIVSIPAVCQRVSLTLEEPVTLTTCISPPPAWGGRGICLFLTAAAKTVNVDAGLERGASPVLGARGEDWGVPSIPPSFNWVLWGGWRVLAGARRGWVPAPPPSPAGLNDPRRRLAACLLSQRSFLSSLFSAGRYY